MPKVSIIILPFRKPHLIQPVFDAIFAQTFQDFEVIAVINDASDGTREIIREKYPSVKIIEPGYNSNFAAGNNIGIHASIGEFIQLVNDDLLLEPNYVEEMLKAFDDQKVAAATGKLLRYDFTKNQKTNIIDTTGIVMSSSGRARDRGQLEIDSGQFDSDTNVFGVSGAGPMYRRSALERVKWGEGEKREFFDEDFVAYWEDVDLSWRLNNSGFKNIYVPKAIAYHGRTAGQSKGGYLHLLKFIQHHKTLNKRILRLNYKNHILMYFKNAKHIWHPAFWLREIAMFGYVLIFETSTLQVLPELFRKIPRALKKRKQWTSR
jgi:GT2 family glycosyltransferase